MYNNIRILQMCNYSLNTATIGNILVIVIEVTCPYTCIHIYIHTHI